MGFRNCTVDATNKSGSLGCFFCFVFLCVLWMNVYISMQICGWTSVESVKLLYGGEKEREGAGEADLRPWVDEGMIQW